MKARFIRLFVTFGALATVAFASGAPKIAGRCIFGC